MADIVIGRIIEAQHTALTRGRLSMWTVYDHPKDFPHSYVARRWEIGDGLDKPTPTDDVVSGELQIIRAGFHVAGMVCLDRHPSDDAGIVETWV